MATIPGTLPQYDTSLTNVVAPTGGEITSGATTGMVVPSEEWNYLWAWSTAWLKFVHDSVTSTILVPIDLCAAQTYTPGAAVTWVVNRSGGYWTWFTSTATNWEVWVDVPVYPDVTISDVHVTYERNSSGTITSALESFDNTGAGTINCEISDSSTSGLVTKSLTVSPVFGSLPYLTLSGQVNRLHFSGLGNGDKIRGCYATVTRNQL